MKTLMKHLFFQLLVLLGFAIPCVAFAAVPRLELLTSVPELSVNQEFFITVTVNQSPPVYAATLQLEFDANHLQVLDSDSEKKGVQLAAGDFIDPDKAFWLRNWADNEEGVADFTVSLLNPSPEASGSGELFRVNFRALSAGRAEIKVAKAQFGTREGATLDADFDKQGLSILINKPLIPIGVVWGLLVLAGLLLLGWLYIKFRTLRLSQVDNDSG